MTLATPPADSEPKPAAGSASAPREKIRIRFAKTGDLRFLGHHDLQRVWDRLFRRAEIPVRFSEGFHPKAHVAMPVALGLGVVGLDELLEIELAEPMDDAELRRRLDAQADPGLSIGAISRHPTRETTRVAALEYTCPLLDEPVEAVRRRAAELTAAETLPFERRHPDKPPRPIDMRPLILELRVEGGLLHFKVAATPAGTPRTDEVLELLGLGRLPFEGAVLVRTRVELAPPAGGASQDSIDHPEQEGHTA